jgi:L-fuconolactonase
MRSDCYNRRRFLRASALAAAGGAVTSWGSASGAEPAAPATGAIGLSLIDTHVHFYDPTRPQGVPWPPRTDKLLYRTVLPKDYRAQPVPWPVTGLVVVEAGTTWLEDNQWVLDLAAHDPMIVGYVGNLPAGTKEFAGHLKRFAANDLFRGIRLSGRNLEASLNDPAYMSDVKLLADHDLSVDLLGGLGILPIADRLVKAAPGLRVIIDHLASVAIDGKAPPAEWAKQIQALAQSPSVYFKISGLVEGTHRSDGSAPRDVEFYRPVLDVMRTTIGPDRLIYASNWPVSSRFAPLATVQGIVGDYFRAFGRPVEEKVFSQSARAAYPPARRDKAKP